RIKQPPSMPAEMDGEWSVDVVFIGLAERVAYVRDSNTNVFKWNVLGLKNVVLSHIYPLSLAGLHIGFAFRSFLNKEYRFSFRTQNGREVGFMNVAGQPASANDADSALRGAGPVLTAQEGWLTAFLQIPPGLTIHEPGTYQ